MKNYEIYVCCLVSLSLINQYQSAPTKTKQKIFGNNYCSELNCPKNTTRCISTDQTIDEYAMTIQHHTECQDIDGIFCAPDARCLI